MPDITPSVEEVYADIIQGPSQIVCADTAKLQSNHRLYNSDIKPDIDHSNTNYNIHLFQTQDKTLGKAVVVLHF